MNAKSFHLSAQGASHIKKNKECQDASLSYQDDNCAIAIVCDGHGGDDYVRSAIGSKLACAVAEKNIKNFILGVDKDTFFSDPEKHLKNLEASIINGWNESITTYHSTKPFTDNELSMVSEKARKKYVEDGRIESAYGTTMVAVAMSREYWFGIHIGDGKCVAINPKGEFKQPIPWDPKCFLNATTSICDSDAIERFRHFYSDKLPAAVFVGSDGIDDCFSNNEQLYNLYKTVLYSFATSNFKEACEGLADYLPRLSAKGSGDDVSVAALLDLDLIPELSIVKEFDREKEKARVEENARKEAEKNEAEKRRVEEEHARFQQQNNAKGRKEQPGGAPKFCENCGERIIPGVKFCSNCGSKIRYADVSVIPPTKPDSVKTIKIIPFGAEPDSEKEALVEESKGAQEDIQPVDNEATIVVKEEESAGKQEKSYISPSAEDVYTTEEQKKIELDSESSSDEALSSDENISQGDVDVVVSEESEIVLIGEAVCDNNENKEFNEEHTDGQEIKNNEDTLGKQENVKQDTDI